jgi:hypothetical protein
MVTTVAAPGCPKGAAMRSIRASRIRMRVGVLAALSFLGAASTPFAEAAPASDLFTAREPLLVELALDFGALCRGERSAKCEDAHGTLSYLDADGTEHGIGVTVRARGRWRNESGNCTVPPLSVTFDSGATDDTLFAGQTMLPLTTHCRDTPTEYEQYVLKEHLAYGIYNELTDKSLRTRLARVTYRDTGRRDRKVERYAFFTEHFDSLAARHGAELWPTENFDPREADPNELATLELFEFMIGNTDWSAVAAHNVAHIRTPAGAVTAVAYDFDFSGIVNAPYATPPAQFRIRRVTQRLYRGFCHPEVDWTQLFARFLDRRGAIERVVQTEIGALEESHRQAALAYLAEFFAIISSPEQRQDDILDACRPLTDRS